VERDVKTLLGKRSQREKDDEEMEEGERAARE
jgi:hypothetical protein